MSGVVTPPRREHWYLIGIFCAALVVQFYCTTLNWNAGFMPRHEFRQAQTAVISYYIDQQNNFSPLYETPIVGKPWVSILMEVPIYEWCVVGLSRVTGLRHVIAARCISLACFYLTLPALYLLLGRLAIPRARRLLILALVLACPVYIFYARAFLMDAMEVMCCAWFLLGFVRAMDGRSWAWLVVAVGAGIAAALIKSVTYAVWLVPAAAYGAWLLWRDFRARTGWRAPLLTVLWGLSAVGPSLLALRWWINLTDPIKAAHTSAWIFTSKNLSEGNWGLDNFSARISGQVWGTLLDRWREAIVAPWIVGVMLVAGLVFFPRQRWGVLGLAGVFFFAQLLFPYAYAYQDYYYYSCVVFLLAAFGLILFGLLDSRLPKWLSWPVILLPFGALFSTYWHGYRPDQLLRVNGGFSYTQAIEKLTPRNSVIIVAGVDWGAIIPLYSQRKALMIRSGLQDDPAYLDRAFNDLAGEDVSALVLVGDLRNDSALLHLTASRFNLDDSTPTFSQGITDVYLNRSYRESALVRLATSERYLGLKVHTPPPAAAVVAPAQGPFDITPAMARTFFPNVFPAPFHGNFAQGVGNFTVGDKVALGSHPDSDLSLRPPAQATRIRWDYGIVAEAYERAGDKTDGVEFIVTGETADGDPRQIYSRILDPVKNSADRGEQQAVISYQPRPGETLIFSTRPYLNYSCDWAYWIRIEVK